MATVGSGQISAISSGQIASAWIVLDGGTLNILAGGGASATLIEGGVVNVSAGGTADATVISTGQQNVHGLAISTVADEETSEVILAGGTAIGTTLGYFADQVVSSGGLASGTIVSSFARLTVDSGGSAVAAVVNAGTEDVFLGAFASGTIIGSQGFELVDFGGTALASIINGGILDVDGGSLGSGAINFSGNGGTLEIDTTSMPTNVISGFVSGDVIDLTAVAFGNDSVVLGSGNQLQVSAGGNSYALQFAASPSFSGLAFYLAPDFDNGTTILLAHPTTVASGITSTGRSVSSGSLLDVSGRTVSTTVAAGGAQIIEAGASESAAAINGYDEVKAGGSAFGATISNGGTQAVVGTAVSTTIGDGGRQDLYGREGTIVDSGTLDIYSGGFASGVTVATFSDLTINAGGTAVGAVVSGFADISFSGFASGMIIASNAEGSVADSGTALGTIIDGGELVLEGGGSLGSALTFSGAGDTLEIQTTAMPTVVMSGFAAGDAIDLSAVRFGNNGIVLSAGNLLRLSVGGTSYDLQFASAENFSGETFYVAPDFEADTDVLLAQVTSTVSAGHSASAPSISSGTLLDVFGTALSATVSRGGAVLVESGGSERFAALASGAYEDVKSGGSSLGATVNYGGTQAVLGLAASTTITGGLQALFGTAVSATIEQGTQFVHSGAVASDTVMLGFGFQDIAGTAISAVVSDGEQTIEAGGLALATIVGAGGVQFVDDLGTASGTVIAGGEEEVGFDGTAFTPTISGGGRLILDASAVISGAIVFAGTGGTLGIDTTSMPSAVISGFTSGDTIDLPEVPFSAGSAVLSSGNLLQITVGGSSYDLQFASGQNFSGRVFFLAPDGFGDTEVLLGQQQTVSAGSTKSGGTLSQGILENVFGTALSVTIQNGAEQFIHSGGKASATVISSGGYQEVESGGKSFGTTFAAYLGHQQVDSGGVDSGSTIGYGGVQVVFGTALSVLVSGGEQDLRGGLASRTTIEQGTQNVFAGGSAVATTVTDGEQQIESGGFASGTILSGGFFAEQLVFSGGLAEATTILGYEEQLIEGGTASGTVIGSHGTEDLFTGAALAVTISGGMLDDEGGSLGNGAITFAGVGGTLEIGTSAVPANTISGFAVGDEIDLNTVRFGSNSVVLTSANQLQIAVAGSSYDLNFASAQSFTGDVFYLAPDSNNDVCILLGQRQAIVSAGSSVSGLTASAGQVLDVFGTVVSASVSGNGAALLIQSGGTESGAAVGNGGYEEVQSGGTTVSAAISGGTQAVVGVAVSAIVVGDGQQNVYGIASATTIGFEGEQFIYSGGLAKAATITGFDGEQSISLGGTASGTTISTGDQFVDSGGLALATTIIGGNFEVQQVQDGGTASGTLIGSGGEEDIQFGATAIAPTVSGAGLLVLEGGAVVSSAIDFAGVGGTLQIDTTSMPANVISGFAVGGIIDLTQVTFSAGGSAVLTSGHQLQVTMGGSSYDLQFDPAQNFSGTFFQFLADQNGDTEIELALPSIVSAGQTVSGTVLSAGVVQDVFGSALSVTVLNGAAQFVLSGGLVSAGDVLGYLEIASGGRAVATSIGSGGQEVIDSGGVDAGATVATFARQVVSAGGTALGTLADGLQTVFGFASAVTVNFGTQSVGFAGTAVSTTLIDSEQIVLSGGLASDTTLSASSEFIETGGVTVSSTVVDGEVEVAAGGTAIGMVLDPGTIAFADAGGTALDTVVSSGASEYVYSGADISGTVIDSGGTLLLEFVAYPAELSGVTNSGVIVIDGVFNNSGQTLSVGSGSPFGQLALGAGGVISGGTVADTGSGLLFQGGALDGVTYQGALNLSAANTQLTIVSGVTVTGSGGTGVGTINLTGPGAMLTVVGSQALDSATVNIGSTVAATLTSFDAGDGAMLTLGPNLTINQVGAIAVLSGSNSAGDGIVNDGVISAGVSGGSFDIAPASFINSGAISAANGDTVGLDAGNVLNASGGTIAVGSASVVALGERSDLVDFNDTPPVNFGIANPYHGFDWTTPNDDFDVVNASTAQQFTGYQNIGPLPENVAFNGFDEQPVIITAANSGTFAFQNVNLAAAWDSSLQVTLTGYLNGQAIGTTSVTVSDSDPTLVSENWGLISELVITATSAHQDLVNSSFVPNDQFVMDDFNLVVPDGGSQWTNDGQINVASGGTLRLGGNLTTASFSGISNNGTLELDGTLNLSGGVLSAGPGTALGNVAIAGTLSGTGIISGTIADLGSITVASGGTIVAAGNVTGSGLLSIGANADLVIDSSTSATADFVGTDGTLTLESPANFTGAIAGYAPGDMIDFVNTTITSATISGAVLSATTSSGQTFTYQLAAPVSGYTVQIANDGAGGNDLILEIADPYSNFDTAALKLSTDVTNNAPASAILSDAIAVYTGAVGGALGTLGGFAWEQAYDNSSEAAQAVSSDLSQSASSATVLKDTLGLYGTIVAGAAGSIANGASAAAYNGILNSVGVLATDITSNAGSATLESDVNAVYSAIVSGGVSGASSSTSKAAADRLAADLAASAGGAQIQSDVAVLYNSIVSGSLNAIGGSALVHDYAGGATVLTLGADIVSGGSAAQLQVDLAGLYNDVVSGSHGSAGAPAISAYQTVLAPIGGLGADLLSGAAGGTLWYDTAGVFNNAVLGELGATVGSGAQNAYGDFGSELNVLAGALSSGSTDYTSELASYNTAESDTFYLALGATAQAAFNAGAQAAQTLGADVTNNAASTQILSDLLNVDALGVAEFDVFNANTSAQAYSAISQAEDKLDADIVNGNAAALSSDVNTVVNALAVGDTNAGDGPRWQQSENTLQQPLVTLVNDIEAHDGTGQITTDASALYDTLVQASESAIGGTDQTLAIYGIMPSTLVGDLAYGSITLSDALTLVNELADSCGPNMFNNQFPKDSVNKTTDFAGVIDTLLGAIFKLLGQAGSNPGDAYITKGLEQALEGIEKGLTNLAKSNVTSYYINNVSYNAFGAGLQSEAGGLLLGGAEVAGAAAASTAIGNVLLGIGLADSAFVGAELAYKLSGHEKDWDQFIETPLGQLLELFHNTIASWVNPFYWIQQAANWGANAGWNPPHPPNGHAKGDVHLTTFDGLHYDFQAAGEFMLTKSTAPGDNFQVQVRLQPWFNSASVSVMTMIGAQVGTDRVTFGLNRANPVWIDGTPDTTLNSNNTIANLNGGQLVQISAGEWQINWNTGESMTVTNDGSYFGIDVSPGLLAAPGNLQGLLGPDEGQALDFQLPDGTVLQQPLSSAELYGEFANAWRVTQANSLLDYSAGQTTSTFTDVNFPGDAISLAELPQSVINQAAAAVASAGITDPTLIEDAELDYIATGDASFIAADATGGTGSTQANISASTPLVAAGVAALSAGVVESAGQVTSVTFEVYLTSAVGSATVVDYTVVSGGAVDFGAPTFGGTFPSGSATISAGQTSAFFTIDVPADTVSASGLPSENLEVTISAPGGNPIFGATAQTLVANSQPVAGNPAVPEFVEFSNQGTFAHSGNAYTLDLGTVPLNETPQIAFAVVNATSAPADDVAGTFTTSGSGVTFSGDSPVAGLAPGQFSNNIVATLTTGSLGANSETLTFTPQEFNASNFTSALAPITLTINYEDVLQANGVVDTPTLIDFGNARVSTAESQAVGVTNATDAGGAPLDAFVSLNGAANGTGSINQLAPGASNSSSITVGLSTISAGAASGIETLTFQSDTGGGNTEFESTQDIDVFGTIFRPGAASLPEIIAHIGDPTTQILPIANSAPNDGYSENLVAGLVGSSGNVTVSGTTTGDIAPQETSSAFSVSYSTASAGFDGTITLDFATDGGGIDGLGTQDLGSRTFNVTVDNFAVAAFEKITSGGTLTHSGNAYTLNLGTISGGVNPVDVELAISNGASISAPADLLSGGFTISGDNAFTNNGFNNFSALGAGQVDGLDVSLNTLANGSISETITLRPTDYNGAGYSSAMAAETFTISAKVVAAPTVVSSGQIRNGIDVKSGSLFVLSGGVTNATVNSAGGTEYVYGFDVGATVNSGGTEIVLSGGHASATTVNHSGTQIVSSAGVVVHALVSGGKESVLSGATAIATYVTGGGAETVHSGGSAVGIAIGSGTVTFSSSAVISGPVGFVQDGGILKLGDASSAFLSGLSIGGLGADDTIDLIGVAFTSGATASASGGFLDVTDGGSSYAIGLGSPNTFPQDTFIVSGDGSGGTVITLSAALFVQSSSHKQTAVHLKSGGTVSITLDMSEHHLTVSGTPGLTLNDGGVATYVSAASNPTNGVLVFTYTVGSGQATPDLQVTGITSGGSVVDSSGNAADLSGAIQDLGLVVDANTPKVTSVSASLPSGSTAHLGETIAIGLQLTDAPLLVGGSPALLLNDGGKAIYDAAASNPASSLLVFDYTVASGQNTSDLKLTGVSFPSGASIADIIGTPANMTLTSAGTDLGLTVNSIRPTLKSLKSSVSAGSEIASGSPLTITLTLSEAVTVSSGASLQLSDGAVATYTSGSGSSTLVFTYVPAAETTADLGISGINGAILDAAGNQFAGSVATDLKVAVNADSWKSGKSGNFLSGANWTLGSAPAASQEASFTVAGAYTVSNTSGTVAALNVGDKTATLLIASGGTFDAVSGTGVGVSLGTIKVQNGATFDVGGTVVNSGTIALSATSSTTTLGIDSAGLTMSGGHITLTADVNNVIAANGSAATFTLVSGTITGAGAIGNNTPLMLINDGMIDANTASALTIDTTIVAGNFGILEGATTAGLVVDGEVNNFRTMEALGTNAELLLNSATVLDVGSAILAASGAGANVQLDDATIVSGTLEAVGNGVIETLSGTTNVISGATISTGLIKAVSGSTLFLRGGIIDPGATVEAASGATISANAITNLGTLFASGAGSIVDIGVVNGGVAKIGNGVVDIRGTSAENVAFQAGGSGGLDLDGVGNAYTGQVSGFGQNTHQFIDFTAIGSAGATVHYTSTGANSGILTVSSGGVFASVDLVGHYTSASFQITSGGGGTVKIVDPPTTEQQPIGGLPRLGIDLSNIAFGAQTTLAYAANVARAGGTLTVTDGRHAASIALLGNYMAGSFVTTADGHGGTLLTAGQMGQQPLLTHPVP